MTSKMITLEFTPLNHVTEKDIKVGSLYLVISMGKIIKAKAIYRTSERPELTGIFFVKIGFISKFLGAAFTSKFCLIFGITHFHHGQLIATRVG